MEAYHFKSVYIKPLNLYALVNSWKGKNEIAKSKVKGNLNTWK